LFEQIGVGGMARVYLGRLFGSGGFTRVVAVKRMHKELSSEPEFVKMFRDEVRLTSRVVHPNVVQTLDVVDKTGEIFLVMEYVHGQSLAQLMQQIAHRRQAVPPAIASSIICGVLHGLHAAHEARSENDEALGIVHRDISPQNILVGRDGVARVLDFGIARGAGREHLTREGQIRGKMAYIAPEILRGREVDPRADIYSVAVVLWEALTGTRLFYGPNDAIVLAKVLSGEMESLRTVAPHLSEGLEAIVMKALDRDPDKRFSSAREMALVLQQEVGVVASCEVGDWVQDLAGEVLAERSRQIVEMERSSGRYAQDGWSHAIGESPDTSEHTAPSSAGKALTHPSPSKEPSRVKKSLSAISLPFRMAIVAVVVGLCAIVFVEFRPKKVASRGPMPRVTAAAQAPAAPPGLAASIGWIGPTAPEPVEPAAAASSAAPAPEAKAPSPKKARPYRRPAKRRQTQENFANNDVSEDGF
jgi:serine/threonine-protein kinase